RADEGMMTVWIHHKTAMIPCLFHPRSCVASSMLGSATQRTPLDLPGRHPIVEFRRMIGMSNAGPLKGIKVVEMGIWVAGPAAAAVLGDWGAEVIKIENPAGGDPVRALAALGMPATLPVNPSVELDNRTKRSVPATGQTPPGLECVRRLFPAAAEFVPTLP